VTRHVFISYARADLEWVAIASRLLRVGGARTFMDVSNI
jgi:hypothetical protein